MNPEILSHSRNNGLLEFFKEMAPKYLSEQDLKDYQAGRKTLYSGELYIRKQLGSLGGIQAVIDENDVQKATRCNLSKGRVPAEMNLVASHVQIRYGYSLALVLPELVDYTNTIYDLADKDFDAGTVGTGDTVYKRAVPVAFANSEYEIKCDDGLVDKGRTVELLTRNVTNDGANGSAKNAIMLKMPKFLRADKTLRLDLRFPDTAVTPAGNHYVEFAIKGIYLGKRPESN